MSPAADLLVVGGGITGLSLAVHATRGGASVVLLDGGALGGASTQRSGALVRTHYDDEGSARLALRGLEHFETFPGRYGGPAGFVRTGFVYVPEAHEIFGGRFHARVAMLRACGIDTEVLDARALAALDPAIALAEDGVVAHEARSGYADPAATCATLAEAARAAGADLRADEPLARLALGDDGAVLGAITARGERLVADRTVLCAGAGSVPLAAGAGVALDVRPTAVKLALFARRVPTHLTVIDAPNGTYLRPDGDGATLVGRRTWTDEPLDGPDAELPEVGAAFVEDARKRLVRRVPSAAGAPVTATRAGMLDMTPDGLPFVGPSEAEGLWLCCGWSGTGFKTGPAVGEALAGWLAGGERPAELAGFDPRRALAGAGAVRSPH